MTGWHIEKKLSIGNIMTTVAAIVVASLWFNNIDKRVDLNARAVAAMEERIGRIEERNTSRFRDIIGRLDTIRDQLANLK